jgi:NADPH2:quinone reductase
MKALVSNAPGLPESLVMSDAPEPSPGAEDVVIAVKAVGVNYPDVLIIQDMYQFKPERPFSPGGEVAGIVLAVGPKVSAVKPGDRVIGPTGWGGMAEQVVVHESRATPIPDAMPFDEASAFLMTYGTSHYALKDRAALKAGETLLVLGAAGGVGIAAVELGKAMGARVVAAASSQDKVDFAIRAGADTGLVYPTGALSKDAKKQLSDDLKRACNGGADVIYDAVGGDYAEPALRAINWDGRYLVIGFPAGIPAIPLNLTLLKSCQIVGVFWGAFTARDPAGNKANIAELFDLYGQGKIKPQISKRFAFAEGAQAIRELMDRKATGKIVVTLE